LAAGERQVVAQCRAKLNLVLEILGRRPDGYHNLATIMHCVELADTLTLGLARSGVTLRTHGLPSPAGDENLVVRAAKAFRAEIGGVGGVRIVLDKRIPAESGLGGGSSDAAGALMALAELHGVPPDDETLLRVARGLGADVPFFLSGGATLAEGTGDRLMTLPAAHFWAVLAVAAPGVSTKWAYQQVGPQHYTDGVRARRAAVSLKRRGGPDEPWNVFMPALSPRRPDLARLAAIMSELTSRPAILTGSGSGVYSMAPNERVARAASEALAARGYWSWSGCSASRPVRLASGEDANSGGGHDR